MIVAYEPGTLPHVVKEFLVRLVVVLFAVPVFPVQIGRACITTSRHTTEVVDLYILLQQSS